MTGAKLDHIATGVRVHNCPALPCPAWPWPALPSSLQPWPALPSSDLRYPPPPHPTPFPANPLHPTHILVTSRSASRRS